MNKLRRFNKILLTVVVVLFAECVVVLKAEALTVGPNNPGSVVSDKVMGSVAWTSPSNALTQNSSYAYVQVSQNAYSDYLNFSNYGFSIPSDATIDGIEVTIYGYMQLISGSGGYDTWFQLRKAGALAGSYKFPYIAYVAGSVVTAGGSSDLWGTTWTPADINNSNFGISAWLSIGSQTMTMMENIDAITIRVYYTASSIPTLVSPTKSSITNATATLGATVSSDGGASISSRGVCYALTATDNTPGFQTAGGSTPEAGVTCVSTSGTTGVFTVPATGLAESSAYTYRGYARNSVGNGYSASDSFTTYGKPTVTTSAAGGITNSEAVLNSSINPNGLSTNVYYLWGETPGVGCSLQPNTLNGPTGLTGTSVLSPNAATLSVGPNKTYYFCVMATNSAGTSYGSVLDFTTPASNPNSYVYMDAASALSGGATDCDDTTGAPCATTTPVVSNPGQTSLTISWSPTTGPAATSYTVRWCQGSGCTPGTNITGITDLFYNHTTSLQCNQTYRYRILAINAAGQQGSGIGEGTTSACVNVPTLTSPTVSSIGQNGATLGANVTSDGGGALTARGTCWGTSNNPTTNCSAASGTTTGTFTHSRTGMPCGTLIYYRGYADNSAGRGYSTSSSFNTSACVSVPTLTNPTVSSIGQNGATLGANVTSDGGASLTARGTCWGTSNPPSTNCQAASGTSTGTFTHSRTGMPCGTLIYFRGYAANSAGTGYSSTSSFNTSTCVSIPTVSSPTVSSIGQNGATLGGNVTNTGGESPITRGTCWGTSNPPSTNCASAGTGSTGAFSHARTGMGCGTSYYYRAYASNSAGTGYSSTSSFTTSSCPLLPNGSSCSTGSQCQSGICYADSDGDRYAPSSGSPTCRASSQLSGTDCNDSYSNVNPGQTAYFTTGIGGGLSFDYNCNGQKDFQALNTLHSFGSLQQNICHASRPSGNVGWYAASSVDCGLQHNTMVCARFSTTACGGWAQASAITTTHGSACPSNVAGSGWAIGGDYLSTTQACR